MLPFWVTYKHISPFQVTTIHPPYGHTRPRLQGPHFDQDMAQQWGKMPLHIEGRSFFINTSPCTSLGDVGFHKMQDPPFGLLQSTPLMGTRVLVCGSHISSQDMALIPSVMAPSQLCRYYPLWGPLPLMILFFLRLNWRKGLYTLKRGHSL